VYHSLSRRPTAVRKAVAALTMAVTALALVACGSSSSSSSGSASSASSPSGGASSGSGSAGGSSQPAAAAGTVGSGGSVSASSKAPLVFANLEGAAAEGGPDFSKGVAIAAAQLNAAGGVMGHPIKIITTEAGLTPDTAVAAYRGAASNPQVMTSMLGGPGGGDAVASQAGREGLPFMELTGNVALVDPPKPYVFAISLDQGYPDSVVNWAVKYHNAKKIALLHFVDDYSSGIQASIQARCKQLGCQLVDSETESDPAAPVNALTPLLEKMKNSGADTYYIETLDPNAAKAARQLGMFTGHTVISEQWLSVPAIAAATGAAGEDITFAAQKCLEPDLAASGDPVSQLCKSYRAAFAKAYPGVPYALFSVYGHDAVMLFAQAAKELWQAGKPVTRDNLNAQYQKFHGEIVTSEGVVSTSPSQHHLDGPFQDGYLLYNLIDKNGKITYVLAPHADPHGAQP
jgi:branched-chain amino acid transport system substrate-binding protein